MNSLLARITSLLTILLLISACSQTPTLKKNAILGYFDPQGNPTTTANPHGSYRKLLNIQNNGYLVQNFFADTQTKQTDPFIIQSKADLAAIDPYSINGTFTQWYRNGQKAGIGQFINGKRQGTFTQWTEKGIKWSEMSFTNDVANGKASLWYENGSRYIEGSYHNGKEQGEWKIWQQDGPLRFTATFDNGEVISAKDAQGKIVHITKQDITTD